MTDFTARLEYKIRGQLRSQQVVHLLGAGSSFVDGERYPLAGELWDCIRDGIEPTHRTAIQAKLDHGADGLEHSLDLLDPGSLSDSPYRHAVTEAIAAPFAPLTPPLEARAEFLRRLSRRREPSMPIFCLSYDTLLERDAELATVRLIDGFVGAERAFLEPGVFPEQVTVIHRGRTLDIALVDCR